MSRRCKVLNVAEKNDVAKEVASIMAGGRFNRVSCHFEFKQPRVLAAHFTSFHIIRLYFFSHDAY